MKMDHKIGIWRSLLVACGCLWSVAAVGQGQTSTAQPDATMILKELSLEATTGDNGAYIFRNLPAGRYTIAVMWAGKETSTSVTVPADPANIKDVDLNAGTR